VNRGSAGEKSDSKTCRLPATLSAKLGPDRQLRASRGQASSERTRSLLPDLGMILPGASRLGGLAHRWPWPAHHMKMSALTVIEATKKTTTPLLQLSRRRSAARDPMQAHDITITAILLNTGPDQKEYLPENHSNAQYQSQPTPLTIRPMMRHHSSHGDRSLGVAGRALTDSGPNGVALAPSSLAIGLCSVLLGFSHLHPIRSLSALCSSAISRSISTFSYP
jgi:hypothetical protein